MYRNTVFGLRPHLDGVPLGVHGLVADEEVEVLDAARQPPRRVVPHLRRLLHRDRRRDDVLRLLVPRIPQLGVPEVKGKSHV